MLKAHFYFCHLLFSCSFPVIGFLSFEIMKMYSLKTFYLFIYLFLCILYVFLEFVAKQKIMQRNGIHPVN